MNKIFITGIAGGFGKPSALSLLKKGYKVAGSVRSRIGKNAESINELESAGAKIIELDVTNDASTQAGVLNAIKHLDGLDIVFNNAGIGSFGIQELMTPEQMSRVFDVNVFGVQRVMRACLPFLRAQGHGTIIYTSSLIGRIVTPFYGSYSASKWALEAIVEAYRMELSGFNIEHCIIEPGAMPTKFFDSLITTTDKAREAEYGDFAKVPEMSNAGLAQLLQQIPMQSPERVAEALVHLLEMPFGKKPIRTVVDFVGVGPQIENYNQVYHEITRNVLRNFGIEDMLKLNA